MGNEEEEEGKRTGRGEDSGHAFMVGGGGHRAKC